MNRCLAAFHRQLRVAATSAIPLCLLLSACGGGGGGDSNVATLPPPPPAPPPPAAEKLDVKVSWLDRAGTQVGNYDLFGRLTVTPGSGDPTYHRTVDPGEFAFSIAPSGDIFKYTLSAPAGMLSGGTTTIATTSPKITWGTDLTNGDQLVWGGGKWTQYLGQHLVAYRIQGDGSEEESESYDFLRGSSSSSQAIGTGKLQSTLTYDVGFSYVAMGEWSWRPVDMNGMQAGDFGDLLFVEGNRTPSSGIPASGTAIYDAHTLQLLGLLHEAGYPGVRFTLTADFGQRTIATLIDQDYHYTDEMPQTSDAILGIHVGGSAPFDNSGSFDIPLAGTVNYSATNSPVTPPSEPVAGDMNGAFFGPHAEEVGGTFALNRPDGTLLVQDAFVGQQRQLPH